MIMRLVKLIGIATVMSVGGFAMTQLATAQKATSGPPDAVQEAQTPQQVREDRVEQRKTAHDRADIFAAPKAPASSPSLEGQPDKGPDGRV
jgi:hypothetical protein